VSDRKGAAPEGRERRRRARPVLSDEMKDAARLRSRGVCECSNPNCWHFRNCKAPSVAFVAKRTPAGVLSCIMLCRECARTAAGREQVL
jgi:hypothetical protein